MNVSPLKHSKLSWRLAVIYASIFTLILFSLNGAVLYGVRWFLLSQATGEINSISNTIAEDILDAPSEQAALTDPELVNEVGASESSSVRIATPDGREVSRSSNFNMDAPAITENLNAAREVKIGDKNVLIKNSTVVDNGSTVAYLQVILNRDREVGFMRILLFLMIAANILGIALSLFAGFLTSKRMLSPIDRMTKTVEEIDAQGLDTHVEVGRADDELSRLAKTFNRMLDRLRLSFEKQNRFVSDASHELRTPIAVIRGYADLLHKWGKENTSIFNESVQAITGETMEMTELIEKLLFIAKSDNNVLKLNKTDFAPSGLLEELAAECRIVSPAHAVHCVCEADGMAHADRLMLKQALRALTENSIKFTPIGGSIELRSSVNERHVVLTVKDTGIGVSEAELGSIFERFYRVDKSRSKETGGSGLGLSIVQLIAKAHGGTVTAESKPGDGMSVSIVLPNTTE